MTKRILFSTIELKRLADVANSECVTIELEREGTTVRVMPYKPLRTVKEKTSRQEEADAALAEWSVSRGKRQ
ncbi:hypothetical protein HFN98_18220 [Rhizobium laguerreae]|uniref:hypothetical protein n=1 Tax=Rhizobium laguerreae TaxID=1076926 RepID=UPI001C929CAA|nr:hypothetical protein [Rhizobium laguerreae]MBY3332546.1 hypothetical protein [Rhizobium laguerreae]